MKIRGINLPKSGEGYPGLIISEILSSVIDIWNKIKSPLMCLFENNFGEDEERIHKISNLLIKNGAEVNHKDNKLNTVLHLAIKNFNNEDLLIKFVELLIQHNFDINSFNESWNSCYAIAFNKHMKKLKDFLLAHGAMKTNHHDE